MTADELDAAYADALERLDAHAGRAGHADAAVPVDDRRAPSSPSEPEVDVRTGRVPGDGAALHRVRPCRRGVPDPARATLPASTPMPTRSTSTACCARSIRRRTCTSCTSTGSTRRLQSRGAGDRARTRGDDPPDRRYPQARRHRRARCRADRRAGQRPEGARRARDARRSRPQRPRPGVHAGHGATSSSSAWSRSTATCRTSSRRSTGEVRGRVRRVRRVRRRPSRTARSPARRRCARCS